jgi:ribosomal-protein-alanine N-acetyltransferase
VTLTIADRPLTADEVAAIGGWRYEPPFDFYDGSNDGNEVLLEQDEEGHGYFPIEDHDAFVGYVCFGPEGRVAGQGDDPTVCDLGIGLDPAKVGKGVGSSLVSAIVEFGTRKFGDQRYRAAVAAFNTRSLRLCSSAGFVEHRRFPGPRGQEFVELIREG